MNILVATQETQDDRPNDFFWTNEGEILRFGAFEVPGTGSGIRVCSHEDEDGDCGCHRSMVGMDTHKGTTTCRVVDMPITRDDLTRLVGESIVRSGFADSYSSVEPEARYHASELINAAQQWAPGSILERRGNRFLPRR